MSAPQGPRRVFSLPPARDRIDDDLQEEFRFHIEERVAQFMAEGMARADAEREVARRFGDYEAHRAITREIDEDTMHLRHRAERWRDLQRELRLAVRALRRSPSFTAIALFTLALGLGATTAIFSVLDAVVLRPLPYRDAEQLVSVVHPATVPGSGERAWGLSPGGYFQFHDNTQTLSSFGIYRNFGMTVTNNDVAELTQTAMITASMFTVLEAKPFAGRLLTADDDTPGSARVVVISREFLERRFGGDPSIVGRTLETSLGSFEIVGVAEPGLRLPMPGPFSSSADLAGFGVDVWLPMRLDPAGPFYNNHPNVGVGRLRPGVPVERAQADFESIFARFTETVPNAYSKGFISSYNFRVKVEPLQRTVLGPTLPRTLWTLLGAVLLVLAIAAANVANLYLVRLDTRRRESAVRTALGADRVQMATHHLAETLLLCVGAALLGLVLAAGALRALQLVAPQDIPRLSTVTLDVRAAAVALSLSLLLGIGLGVLPLFRRRIDVEALRAGTRGQPASPRQRLVRNSLVVGQLAMALTLMAGAGFMLRSFDALRRVDPGFRTDHTLVFDLSLPYNEYGKRSAALAFHRELHTRLANLPGVTSVGAIGSVPLEGFGTGCSVVFRENVPYAADEQTPCVSTPSATPGALAALGLQVEGRLPTWGDVDGRTQAVVVTRALADHLWPGQDPIGKGIGSNGPDSPWWYRVVGVADNIRAEALDAPPTEAVFYAATGLREDDDGGALNDLSYVVRTSGSDPMSLVPAVRAAVREISGHVPVIAPRTMDAVLSRSMARTTFLMVLLGVAAGVALLLSAVGIYGVVSYVVTLRRTEIGIRMALGASVRGVVRMVLAQSVRLALAGIVIGVAGAAMGARLLRAVMFGVTGSDPLVLGGGVLVLLLTTLLASVIPARRAAHVDPSEAMRSG